MKSNVLSKLLFLLSAFCATAGFGQSLTKPVVDPTIFELSVGKEGQKIAVVRGPDRPPSILGAILPQDDVKQSASVYELRVELSSPGQTALLVASTLRREMANDPADRGVSVLASNVVPTGIDLVIAEGSWIMVWRVNFGGTSTLFQRLDRWSGYQAPYTISKSKTMASVGLTDDRRCRVVVTEGGTGLQTVFEQPKRGTAEVLKISQSKVATK